MGNQNQGQDGVYYNNNNNADYTYTDNDDGASYTYLSDIHTTSTITGIFGIDPLNFTKFVICCLTAWLVYLFIPRGYRFAYCGSYPKRYAWSARIKRKRRKIQMGGIGGGSSSSLPQHYVGNRHTNGNGHGGGNGNGNSQSIGHSGSSIISAETSSTMNTNHRELSAQGIGTDTNTNTNSNNNNNNGHGNIHMPNPNAKLQQFHNSSISSRSRRPQSLPEEEVVDFSTPPPRLPPSHTHNNQQHQHRNNNINNPHQTPLQTPFQTIQPQSNPFSSGAATSTFNDEIAISTTMQQLRDTGVQIIAHGSKGKPKKVRLVLTENAIEWRTESKRKNKVGKMHQVPLTHIMYVDVGKATTALRRMENAAIPEHLCLSLLTKEGSLDLEASDGLERDALVNCFSLVLDEVHAQNWRDVYRAPSSDMPSSFDEFDMSGGAVGGRMDI